MLTYNQCKDFRNIDQPSGRVYDVPTGLYPSVTTVLKATTNMSDAMVFDIETGALPLPELQKILPAYDPGSQKHPGEFDPKSVKLGNTKQEDLIQKKIEEARVKHEESVKQFESSLAGAEDRYWASIIEKAALSAITGQVVAIGYKSAKNGMI